MVKYQRRKVKQKYFLSLKSFTIEIAYSNILKILRKKKLKFSDKNSDIFHISAKNIDYGYSLEPHRRAGSNGCPQAMLLSRNKKIMCTL